nr:uncharacterized protein CTRU02_06090 [Colletotrichum truncatum]KAF6793218.1 hypothetical protein CTRU02_06090 [Colletotrichum truncatum]
MQFFPLFYTLLGATLVSAGCKNCLASDSGRYACMDDNGGCLDARVSSKFPFGAKVCCDEASNPHVSCNRECVH